jgi:hypothetical protein
MLIARRLGIPIPSTGGPSTWVLVPERQGTQALGVQPEAKLRDPACFGFCLLFVAGAMSIPSPE